MRFTGYLLVSVVTLLLAGCQGSGSSPVPVRLYVFDCGSLLFEDVAEFDISNAETPTRELFVPCYLVQHPEGNLLWDAGLDPALVGQGTVELQPGVTMRYERSVTDQLAELGLTPDDIDYLGLSHMHFDHVGAGKLFPNARMVIQRDEYQAAFVDYRDYAVFVHETYAELEDNPRLLLDGDRDLFGDGRVMMISAPGHTPGHQVLLVRLNETGPVLLSGDLYHFAETRSLRRVPSFNISRDETLASMEKVEAVIQAEGATLWIEHEMALARSLNLAPGYYE